jgi:hypothetical protein
MIKAPRVLLSQRRFLSGAAVPLKRAELGEAKPHGVPPPRNHSSSPPYELKISQLKASPNLAGYDVFYFIHLSSIK